MFSLSWLLILLIDHKYTGICYVWIGDPLLFNEIAWISITTVLTKVFYIILSSAKTFFSLRQALLVLEAFCDLQQEWAPVPQAAP